MGKQGRNPSFLRRFTLKMSNTCKNAILNISLLFKPQTYRFEFITSRILIPEYGESNALKVNDRGNGSRSKGITILLHYLQIETKFMMRNKIIFYRFSYFTKRCGKIPTANPFISTVKGGRKLMTHPCNLITKSKNSVTNAIVLVAISITDLP